MGHILKREVYLSTIESKNKLTKPEQRQNHGYREGFDGYQMGGGCGEIGEEMRELKVQTGSYRIAMGM